MTSPAVEVLPPVEPPAGEDTTGDYPLHGILTQEGEDTGDCRTFQSGSLVWDFDAAGPLPFRWAEADLGAHQGARHVGWIDSITRVGDDVQWEGRGFDPNFQVYIDRAGRCGVSVDCDDESYTVFTPPDAVEEPLPGEPQKSFCQMEVYDHARIRAATAVDIPAFIKSWVEPGPGPSEVSAPEAPALVAAAPPAGAEMPSLPVTDMDPPPALSTPPTHAGLMLVAGDTGRVLMLQRALEEGDPNGGLWEFPGGGIDEGEDPETAARREFGEEVGVPVPADAVPCDLQVRGDGVYALFVMDIPTEAEVPINDRQVSNPDDPEGDQVEAVAWWDVSQICDGAPIRPEVLAEPLPYVPAQEEDAMTAAADAPPADAPPADAPVTDPTDTPDEPAEGTPEDAVEDLGTALDLIGQIISLADPSPDDYTTSVMSTLTGGLVSTLASVTSLVDVAPDDYTSQVTDLAGQALTELDPVNYPDSSLAPNATDALIASAFASTGVAPVAPPDEWFEPFAMPPGTPVTVLASGQVFGRLAEWNSCHGSDEFAGQCVRPPSDPDARNFHLGQVLTASGKMLDIGTITVGGGHADRRLGLVAALEHYDDAGTGVATVRVHEDGIGIGIFGSIVANATPEQVAALRRAPLSGDWRKSRRGGKWNLIAAHAVVTPGYAIPKGLVASIGPEAFISSGRVCADCGEETTPDYLPDALVASIKSRYAADMGPALADMRTSYAKRMGDLSALVNEES